VLGLAAAVVPVFPVPDRRPTRNQMKAATRARWREWRRLLDEGVYGSKAELARGEGVSRAAVTKGLAKLPV
jgi:hypothetical protein